MTVTQKIGRVYYGWWNAAASFVCLMLDYRLRDIPHFPRRSEHQPALGSLHREGSRPRCRACSSSFQRYVRRRRVRENWLWLDLRQGLHSRYSGLLHSAGHWHSACVPRQRSSDRPCIFPGSGISSRWTPRPKSDLREALLRPDSTRQAHRHSESSPFLVETLHGS